MRGQYSNPKAHPGNDKLPWALRGGIDPFKAGLIALVVIAAATYFAFSKQNPFEGHYEIRAVFQNSNLLQPRSPVRIAGVDVGQVTRVERYGTTHYAVATLRVNGNGRPLHNNASVKIRPRIFLEGNFYLDLKPGTPQSPEMANGGTIPITRTSRPVQIDQFLSALTTPTRRSLQKTLNGFGAALNSAPSAADDAAQDPQVRGLTGAQALNKTLRSSPKALRDSAIVSQALLGVRPGDLSRTVRGFARATAGLSQDERALRQLFPEFGRTVGALAARAPALSHTVALLGPTAENANKGFGALLAALPPTRRFARELVPAAQETPATIAAAYPWLAQASPLLGKRELRGLLSELRPATSQLAQLGAETKAWLPDIDRFNRCMTDVFLPTGNVKVGDGRLSAGAENYKEFFYAMVGQAGEGQFFDGNGPLLRIAAAGGPHTFETGKSNYSNEPFFANAPLPPTATRPAFPNKIPPLRRDVPCYKSGVPDVNGPASHGPADGSNPNAAPPRIPGDPSTRKAG